MFYFLALSPLKNGRAGGRIEIYPPLSLKTPFFVDLQSPILSTISFISSSGFRSDHLRILNSPFGRLLQAIGKMRPGRLLQDTMSLWPNSSPWFFLVFFPLSPEGYFSSTWVRAAANPFLAHFRDHFTHDHLGRDAYLHWAVVGWPLSFTSRISLAGSWNSGTGGRDFVHDPDPDFPAGS